MAPGGQTTGKIAAEVKDSFPRLGTFAFTDIRGESSRGGWALTSPSGDVWGMVCVCVCVRACMYVCVFDV